MIKITKNPLVIILFTGAIIYGLYYLMSPYQQCLRSMTQTSDLYNFSVIKNVYAEEEIDYGNDPIVEELDYSNSTLVEELDHSGSTLLTPKKKKVSKSIKIYCNRNTSW